MAVVWTVLLASNAAKPECRKGLGNGDFTCKRQYVAMYDGPGTILGNETAFSQNIGNCSSTWDLAAKMFEHFMAFGIDLSPLMENPFQYYENDLFDVIPHVANPDTNYRIILKIQDAYVDVVNSPIKNAVWALAAKADLTGQGGRLPAGHLSFYGMLR